MPGRKPVFLFLTLCTFLFVFFLSLCKIYDYDIWFHLKTGEYILKTWSVPRTDIFSHTAPGQPWVAQEWLFGVLMRMAYSAGGVGALTFYKVTLITAVCAVIYFHLLKRGVSLYIAVHATLLAAVFISWRSLEKPELFGYLFITLYIFILEGFRRGVMSRKFLWALPAVMLLWVNLQYTALLGLGIAGAFLADSFLSILRRRSLSDFYYLLLVTAAISLAMLINPNTYRSFTFPLKVISEIEAFTIEEFLPPTWDEYPLFFVSFGVSVPIILLNFRRAALAHMLIFTAFSYAAFKHNRNISFWAVASIPFLALYLNDLKERLMARRVASAGRLLRDSVLVAASVAVILALSYLVIGGLVRTGWWGYGIRENWHPERAVRFIRSAGIRGNMYNSYELGGYLIWSLYPESRVYQDGRADVYTDLIKMESFLLTGGFGFGYVLDSYGVEFAVVGYKDRNIGHFIGPELKEKMALVYWDDVAMVFVRRTPPNEGIIREYGYSFVKPADTAFTYTDLRSIGSVLDEVERNVRENPNGWRNHMLLGNLYGLLGYQDRKEKEKEIAYRNSRM